MQDSKNPNHVFEICGVEVPEALALLLPIGLGPLSFRMVVGQPILAAVEVWKESGAALVGLDGTEALTNWSQENVRHEAGLAGATLR